MEGGGGDRENGQGQERGDRGGSGAGNLGQGGQGSGAPLGSSSQAHTGQNDQASVVNILSQIRAGRSGRVYASQIQRQPNALTRAQSLGTSTTTDAQGRFQIHSYNSSPGGGPQMDICAPLPGVPGGLDILTQDPEAITSVVRAMLQQPGVSSVDVVIFPNHSAEQLDEIARTTGSPIQPAELSGVNFRTVRRRARRQARAARRQAREAAAQPAPSNETNVEPPAPSDLSWLQVLEDHRREVGKAFSPPRFFPWTRDFTREWVRRLHDASRAAAPRFYDTADREVLPVDPETASLQVIDQRYGTTGL
ncbi:hypothetical protein PLICBS_005481 [Purpureocillium lilacinum]|uniref:uncharacterized protein n=1 Tax=Purpureocillium lilacinum TaxID=33203 RepID=UPI0020853D07|nr:hypothetical protein PLICBS_005481 [Purpureocillium lilacinum]